MTNRLANRVALITGAGSGIGQGCALRLAVEGARVIVADLHKEGGEETFAKIAGPERAVAIENRQRRPQLKNGFNEDGCHK